MQQTCLPKKQYAAAVSKPNPNIPPNRNPSPSRMCANFEPAIPKSTVGVAAINQGTSDSIFAVSRVPNYFTPFNARNSV